MISDKQGLKETQDCQVQEKSNKAVSDFFPKLNVAFGNSSVRISVHFKMRGLLLFLLFLAAIFRLAGIVCGLW